MWVGATQHNPDGIDRLTEKSSRLHALLRVVAYARRFVSNCRKPRPKRDIGLLIANETQSALLELIRRAQSSSYQTEIDDLKKRGRIDPSSSLVKLTPFLDQRGLLCVGGRIENAPVPFGARHQIILPSKARITELLVYDIHHRLAHVSAERTLHEVRYRYWIPRGRLTIKRILNKCF